MQKKKFFKRTLINNIFLAAFDLWIKGYPVRVGELTFKTQRKQVLFIKKSKKKFKKPYYVINFTPQDIFLTEKKEVRRIYKLYNLNKRQIEALTAVIHK
jgi:hypothetical protein